MFASSELCSVLCVGCFSFGVLGSGCGVAVCALVRLSGECTYDGVICAGCRGVGFLCRGERLRCGAGGNVILSPGECAQVQDNARLPLVFSEVVFSFHQTCDKSSVSRGGVVECGLRSEARRLAVLLAAHVKDFPSACVACAFSSVAGVCRFELHGVLARVCVAGVVVAVVR